MHTSIHIFKDFLQLTLKLGTLIFIFILPQQNKTNQQQQQQKLYLIYKRLASIPFKDLSEICQVCSRYILERYGMRYANKICAWSRKTTEVLRFHQNLNAENLLQE